MPLRLGEDCYCSKNLILTNTLSSVDPANEPVSLPFKSITVIRNVFNIYLLNIHPRCSTESLTKSSLLTFITLPQVTLILPKLQVWQQSLIFSSLYIPNAFINFLIVLKRFLFCFVGSQFEGKAHHVRADMAAGAGAAGQLHTQLEYKVRWIRCSACFLLFIQPGILAHRTGAVHN